MSYRWSLAFVIAGLSVPGVASACPSTYSSYACNGGSAADICQVTTETNWECDLVRNGDTVAGSVTAVGGLGSDDYSAWGTDAAGNNFCCNLSGIDLDRVAVFGGSYADTISFTTTVSGVAYDLENMGAASTLVGFVGARGGNDTVYGSNTTGSSYADMLHGDDGNDTLRGYAGGDEITGDLGNDTLYGGSGADTLHGNDGDDTIYGEGGADSITGDGGDDIVNGGGDSDFIVGNTGADRVSGGAGNDSINGDEGNDILCGGSDADSICGGMDDDQLWGDGGTDSALGGAGTDSCSAETINECESTLSRKPSTCP